MQESAAPHPSRFVTDLTSAMRAAAEAARQTTVDQCKADANAFVEHLRARIGEESQRLHKETEDDVATIREQSRASVERVRVDTERRIARRSELLEQELHEYNSAVELEIAKVQERVAAFEREVALFFEHLQGADPTAFAAMASQMPGPPAFEKLDLQELASEVLSKGEAAVRAAAAEAAGVDGEEGELPAYWWLDSPDKLAAEARETENTEAPT